MSDRSMLQPEDYVEPACVLCGEPYGAENTVSVHIRHIREKLEINPAEPRWIKAVWGRGYKFERSGK